MSSAELLLILIVALVAFGPSKLPMLAHHLASLVRLIQHYQQQLTQFWQAQQNAYQLEENLKKAEKADANYDAKPIHSKPEDTL